MSSVIDHGWRRYWRDDVLSGGCRDARRYSEFGNSVLKCRFSFSRNRHLRRRKFGLAGRHRPHRQCAACSLQWNVWRSLRCRSDSRNALLPRSWCSAGHSTVPGTSFALVGNLYFHYCASSSPGSGANCASTAFTDTLTLGSGALSYIAGDIVVDQLSLLANSNITVSLNPNPQYYVLKASLLQ